MTGSQRFSDRYFVGMRGFIVAAEKEMAKRNAQIIQCPCVTCGNNILHPINIIEDHLITKGFMDGYTCWTKHGEDSVMGEDNNLAAEIQNSEPRHIDIEFYCMGEMETPNRMQTLRCQTGRNKTEIVRCHLIMMSMMIYQISMP